MSNNGNYHFNVGKDGLPVHPHLRARTHNNRPYLPSSALILDEPRRLMEHYYPDPIAAMREKLRAVDRQFLRSCPYVFQIHDSWIASYPVSDWRGLSHRIAIFHDWGDAMKFANEVAARD